MGTGLPGAKQAPAKKTPSKSHKSKGGEGDSEEGKIEELSFEEIKALEAEFVQLTQGKTAKDLEGIRKKREEDELLGRERAPEEERVSLSEIETAFESKKGGMPEHLASLPPEHPLRARFEQGFRRRPDGTWFKAVPDPDGARGRKSGSKTSALFYWIPVIMLIIMMISGLRSYQKALEQKRAVIIGIIKKKGLALDNPVIRQKYTLILVTNWLPDLDRLLREIQRMPRNYDVFPDNKEEGTYMEYIDRHDLPFDEMDAQEWYTRSIRKPVHAK